MTKITWKEFKERVDQELAAKGLDDSIEVGYIDWSPDYFPNPPLVEADGKEGLRVH